MAKKNKINKTDLYVLKEELGIKQFNAFPGDISLKYDKTQRKLVMTLKKEAAGFLNPINMQDNRACFEAWCLIIKAQTTIPYLKIELGVEGIDDSMYLIGQLSNGHLGRFLYRILKFSEQYAMWFELSPTLEGLKDKFKYYLVLPGVKFVTSVPDKEASDNLDDLKNNLESYIEYVFWDSYRAQRDILKLDRGAIVGRQLPVSLFEKDKFKYYLVLPGVKFVTSVPDKEASDNLDDLKNNLESYIEYVFWDSYRAQRDILKLDRGAIVGRQLPVSLFEGSSGNGNEVFTRQKSAIDFWAVDRETINVYELKVNNPMVGIITEIFFYSNYVHDVFISKSLDHGKGHVTPADGTDRSYNKINGKQVKGIMLSNRRDDDKGWHSSLDESTRRKITDIINTNGTAGIIQYMFLKYNFKMSITVTP